MRKARRHGCTCSSPGPAEGQALPFGVARFSRGGCRDGRLPPVLSGWPSVPRPVPDSEYTGEGACPRPTRGDSPVTTSSNGERGGDWIQFPAFPDQHCSFTLVPRPGRRPSQSPEQGLSECPREPRGTRLIARGAEAGRAAGPGRMEGMLAETLAPEAASRWEFRAQLRGSGSACVTAGLWVPAAPRCSAMTF